MFVEICQYTKIIRAQFNRNDSPHGSTTEFGNIIAVWLFHAFVRIRDFFASRHLTEQVPNDITHHLSTLLINRKQDVVFAYLSKAFGSSHQFLLAKVVHLFYYLDVILPLILQK